MSRLRCIKYLNMVNKEMSYQMWTIIPPKISRSGVASSSETPFLLKGILIYILAK
jgi:hypothetical protein